MFTHRSAPVVLALAASLIAPIAAQRAATESVDLDALYRIKEEGLQRSKIMETASYLTDVYGPRLTGSPNIREAADWAQQTMRDWGLSNVHLETFPFGRGWQNERFVAHAMTPRAYPIIAMSRAWTPGTNGPVTAPAMAVLINSEADFDRYRGKLKGAFALATPMRDVAAQIPATRHPLHRSRPRTDRAAAAAQHGRSVVSSPAANNARAAFQVKVRQFLLDEQVAAVLEPSRGDGGTMFVLGGGSRTASDPAQPAQFIVAIEHYGRIWRTLEKNIPVTLQFDVKNSFLGGDTNAFNVIAEIPGTDRADEVVMVGAHFDSWHGATGATDNVAGSAVMMEALRILKTSGVRLRRTVRIGLWSGEEQGLLGSRAYVRDHFGDRAAMTLKPEHAKFSGYFNVDNGTGAIRGVYLQSNEAISPLFGLWMEPFRNLGMTTLTIRNTTGTDHLAFDEVGLPGFQFVQDPVEYDTRTHHSNMDYYERLQPLDMMNNAVIVASFVANTANRDTLLPRKPLPRARR